ncbi:uncharacterized protein FA14DRAFT_154159 [Meira miltonrushii]|uniref:Uncharacterized protein n=1 Tax=Meira miltonrushii TaxID=1280837 RepID=A0A316VC65_9BASI|nr:uncharacterized protein FA14DRAFT_154159 [Meira miltonrushii]PWN34708.1 hypothetical protein FA14DRAFT_154159 [Meira miltonrushii]
MATSSYSSQKQWSPPKPSYNSPKPAMKSSSTTPKPQSTIDDQMFIRDAFLLNMERMHNWTFKDSHSIKDREIQDKYSITCSPKSQNISLFEDEHRDSFDVSSSNASLSTEQSVFEGWDESDMREEHDRTQLSPKQHLLASKKWASSTAKALSSKKLFSMSNRVMNDISSSLSHRNDSFFEEIMEGALSPTMNRSDRFPSSASRTSLETSSHYQSAWGSLEERSMIGLGLEDLHGSPAKTEKPFRQTGSPLSFDPFRRPRAPFPQGQGEVQRPIPKKAAMLLGTYTDQSAVSPLSKSLQSPTRSPCPDRMNGISEMTRPKPEVPLKSPTRPPVRPKRPTESDIFADMVDKPLPQQQQLLPQRPPRPNRRRLPKPLPIPTTPLPDVPVSPNDDDVATPIGWVNDSGGKRANNYSAYNKFEAELTHVEGSFNRDTTKVILEVGGMQFNSTFSTLCPHDIPVRQFGLASWLRKIGDGLEEDSEETRSHSFTSSDEDDLGTDRGGLSTVENSPSVRTPGLFEHPYNPLDKNNVLRNNLANLPKSVSNESQLSFVSVDAKKSSSIFAYDTDANAPRNSFGMDFVPRRTSSCSDLQRISNGHKQTASFNDQMPALVFTPKSNKFKQKPVSKQSSSSVLHIVLANDRNPLCYPIILHLLQFGKLPAYFSTQTAQNRSLLRCIRQECFWLGYMHLSHLCT